MKAELSPADSSAHQGKLEKLLGLCLSRQKLLQIERNIGTDFDRLKQTLVGCLVRVLVQGRPMLAAIQSVEDRCQIEWAWLERRLFLPPLGYFNFGQIHPEMPKQDEMARWCQRRQQNALGPLSMEFIDAKLALLKMSLFIVEENRPTTRAEQPVQQDQEHCYETASISAAPIYYVHERDEEEAESEDAQGFEAISSNLAYDNSDKIRDEFHQEEGTSVNINYELPNVEGMVQSRELLIQVLLPCKDFLKWFSINVKTNMISRATAGCLMAFRIAGKLEDSKVIVDEIVSVKKMNQTAPSVIHFKFGLTINASRLVAMDERREITDRVFDQWLQRLAIRNEPVPSLLDKQTRKIFAIDRLAKEAEWAKQLGSNLPDISPIIVTAREVQLLTDHLEQAELNRVLTDCFMTVKIKKYELGLERQPKMRSLFVVPIVRVLTVQITRMKGPRKDVAETTNRPSLYFTNRIPIRHRKTGQRLAGCEVWLQNVFDERLCGLHKLVEQSLLMLAELNIPLPSDEAVVRKTKELNAALAKASHKRDRPYLYVLPSTSTSVPVNLPNRPAAQLQSPPCCSSTTTADDISIGDTRESRRISEQFLEPRTSSSSITDNNNNMTEDIYEFFFHPPVFFQIPMAAATMRRFSSPAAAVHSSPHFFNFHGPNDRSNISNSSSDVLAKVDDSLNCCQEIATASTTNCHHQQLSPPTSADQTLHPPPSAATPPMVTTTTTALSSSSSLATAAAINTTSPMFFNCQQSGPILGSNNGEHIKVKKKRRIGTISTTTDDDDPDEECGGKRRYNLRPRK